MATTWYTTTDSTTYNNATANWQTIRWESCSNYILGDPTPEGPKLPEGVTMKALYEVILCYGEDRKDPIVVYAPKPKVVAESEEDAKIKSGVFSVIDNKWDADFLTILVRKLGDVRVKERAKEVKTV